MRALAERYGVNQKTVAKWRKRSSVEDLPTGPREPKSTVLSIEEEAIVVAFRRPMLLPLKLALRPASRTGGLSLVQLQATGCASGGRS